MKSGRKFLLTNLLYLKRIVNRYAHGGFGDAVTCEDTALSLWRRTTMASHGGNDKRLRPNPSKLANHFCYDLAQMRNAATANANCNP